MEVYDRRDQISGNQTKTVYLPLYFFFKTSIVAVNFEDDGIMYTVRHFTDNFTHVVHISDFVAMGDGSYPRMKCIAKADVLAHKTWMRVMEDF